MMRLLRTAVALVALPAIVLLATDAMAVTIHDKIKSLPHVI
jgi:hypothetical protein